MSTSMKAVLETKYLATLTSCYTKDRWAAGDPYHFIGDGSLVSHTTTPLFRDDILLWFEDGEIRFVDYQGNFINPDLLPTHFICDVNSEPDSVYYRVSTLPSGGNFMRKQDIAHYVMPGAKEFICNGFGQRVDANGMVIEETVTKSEDRHSPYFLRMVLSLVAAYLLCTIALLVFGVEPLSTSYLFAIIGTLIVLFSETDAMQSMPKLFGTTLLAAALGFIGGRFAVETLTWWSVDSLLRVAMLLVVCVVVGYLVMLIYNSTKRRT